MIGIWHNNLLGSDQHTIAFVRAHFFPLYSLGDNPITLVNILEE